MSLDDSAVPPAYDWLAEWCPPTETPPSGRPHGSSGICAVGDDIVLVSPDGGVLWSLPGGRPEPGETPYDTLVREVAEEACATVTGARLLGYSRGTCVAGPEKGLVLVRALWLAEVTIDPWSPTFEMTDRVLVPGGEAFGRVAKEAGQLHIYRRHFAEAGLPVG